METLQYKIIKTEQQYWDYCNRLEELVMSENKDNEIAEEIDLLKLLIEKWDEENDSLGQSDPIEVLKYLMGEHHLKAKDLAVLLGLSKSFISEILSYKKGFSKENIRKLAEYFKVKQELFNKPYKMLSPSASQLKKASMISVPEKLNTAHG